MTAAGSVPVISARSVVKGYGPAPVLRDVTVDIPSGITGLLGANGSGKTTFFGLLLGLHQVDGGELRVLGLDPGRSGPAVRERIGYAPEHHRLPADVQALDLVRHLAEVHGLPPREAMSRASDALWQVELGEERLRPVGTMSTGQRQRVKLAAAIAHDPRLLLLDEPTDGLDPPQRDAMLALIGRIGHEFGIDVVLSSHLLDEVERTCDHVAILAQGAIISAGSLSELRRGSSGVVVELEHGKDAVASVLRQAGWTVNELGTGLEVTAASSEENAAFDAVRDAVAHTGASIRRLHARRATLEEVYLEATT
ncbi:MAG: ABC transporter ATP-binding protein [Acidimicrobiales bacterium]